MHASIIRPAAVAAALLAPLAVAATAEAATVLRDGSTLVFRGGPGEVNHMQVSDDQFGSTRIMLGDRTDRPVVVDASAADLDCQLTTTGFGGFARCSYEGIRTIRLEGADGDDELDVNWVDLPAAITYVLDGGPGSDHMEGPTTDFPITMLGGDGDDQVLGGQGVDQLDGGPGNDVVSGGKAGDDVVRGGPGDDTLTGGSDVSADVVDGGPGRDSIVNDWFDANVLDTPPIRVTLDGRADDGRPGEGDNVTGVERIRVAVVATLVAGSDPVEFDVEKSPSGSSKLVGSPGADRLAAYSGNDRIDGQGGRDVIFAGMGNDRIEARDGERDVVDCSDGRDVAHVDRVDVVENCERVKRGGRRKG